MTEFLKDFSAVLVALAAIITTLWGGRSSRRQRSALEEAIARSNMSKAQKDKCAEDIDKTKKSFVISAIVASAATVALVFHVVVVIIGNQDPARLARRSLSVADSSVFNEHPNAEFEVARTFSSRSALEQESPMAAVFDDAHKSMDFYAIAGTILANVEKNVRSAVKRGVAVRVLLTDFGPTNEAFLAAYARAQGVRTDLHVGRALQTRDILRKIQDDARRDSETYRGSLQVRWVPLPFHNSIWVRDGEVAHVALTFFQRENSGPCIHFGVMSNAVPVLEQEFRTLWEKALEEPSVK